MFNLISLFSLFQCSEGNFTITSETGESLANMFQNYVSQNFCMHKHFGVTASSYKKCHNSVVSVCDACKIKAKE